MEIRIGRHKNALQPTIIIICIFDRFKCVISDSEVLLEYKNNSGDNETRQIW